MRFSTLRKLLGVPAVEPLGSLAAGEPQGPLVLRSSHSGDGHVTLAGSSDLAHAQRTAAQEGGLHGSDIAHHLAAFRQKSRTKTVRHRSKTRRKHSEIPLTKQPTPKHSRPPIHSPKHHTSLQFKLGMEPRGCERITQHPLV